MKDRKAWLPYLALVATALMTLAPFFQVGFTTGDDFQYYNTARQSWAEQRHDAQVYAQGAGRFYFLVTKVFYYVPYLIDSFAYTKAVQYLSLLTCYALFAYFVYRLFKSRQIALLTLLLLIFDTVLTPNNHIPTIAYPFYFSFSLIIFTCGLLLFLNHHKRGGYWRILLSALLFFVAYLFYETYLIFAIIFCLIIVIYHWRSIGFKAIFTSAALWKLLLPYIITAVAYVGCYFGYRQYLLTLEPDRIFYDGAAFSMSDFSLKGFYDVLSRCTKAALPGQSYFENQTLLIENSPSVGGHKNNLIRVLTHAPFIVWVNAAVQVVLLWYITRDKEYKNIKTKYILTGIAISIFAAFFAHTLIGMAKKYNLEWSSWIRGYVTTFFSIFGLMLALGLLIILTIKLCKQKRARQWVRGAWCVMLVLFSVLMGYSNHIIARGWVNSQNRMELLDLIGKTEYFNSLPPDATLYTAELRNTSWQANDICKESRNLENYIDKSTGKCFNYASDIEDLRNLAPNAPLYYIHAVETKKNCELLISISAIDSILSLDSMQFSSSQTDVFYLSATKMYTVFYQAQGTWKAVPNGYEHCIDRLTELHISDSAIDPRSIVISDMAIAQ